MRLHIGRETLRVDGREQPDTLISRVCFVLDGLKEIFEVAPVRW